ncbi:ETEC_3214 domain-containing protein [Arthrobacter sp. UYCo732]|uniref:ETEC_3214 domain-containing protein n=1 Tax=Arthrobacter sp. UYCo732 TaxID=3156336 RepID=UPI003395466C
MNQSSSSKTCTAKMSKWQRRRTVFWPRAKAAGKAIIALAGLGAAVVAIYAWFPAARDALWPELREYKTLDTLYAGASVTFFDSALGSPDIVRAVEGEAGTTERLYIKENYIVQTLATPEGETQLFSVLSCSQDFKPKLGGRITLQDKPLAEQLTTGQQPRELYYLMPAHVLNAVYFELTVEAGVPSRNRGSGYGVNSACAKDLPGQESYVGPASNATQAIKDFRTRVPANFYVETYKRELADVTQSGSRFYTRVTPLFEDIPPRWRTS